MEDGKAQPTKGPSRGVKIAISIICLVLIIGLINLFSSSGQNSSSGTHIGNSTSTQNNSSSASVDSTDPIAQACQGYATSSATTISYKQLEKNPDSFLGQDAIYTGQVIQIQESNGQGFIRLAVDRDAYGNWNINDVVLVEYDGHKSAVDNDVVTVRGVMEGSQTYTSEANFQITVPLMYACAIEEGAVRDASKSIQTYTQPSAPTQQSQQTNTPLIQTSQSAPKATWHTVYTYSGSDNIKTPSFALQGAQQKIFYSCSIIDSAVGSSWFNGIIQSTDNSGSDPFAGVVNCPTSNTTYEYSLSPGQYYLDLSSGNSSSTVNIEDYY